MITRNGIVYDLSISSYRHTVNGVTFVFSSKLYLYKFKKRLQENREIINYSLSKRFNIPIDVSPLADFVLYSKIESRGFLVIDAEGNELCQEKVIYAGGAVMPRSSVT